MANKDFNERALQYHENPIPGKLEIAMTKSTATQNDLSLAYSPGVAVPVMKIAEQADEVYRYTTKGNLIAVITNGSAVLGLGNVGPLASKPVMEGKAVLFKRFADVNVFDIEIDADNPQDFIDTVVRIAPTFGGINLEDIKAPECFAIEKAISDQVDIPVFHDDQHGTAIIVVAGLLNALQLQNKQLTNCKIVCVGAGAAGIATLRLLLAIGVSKENIILADSRGIIHKGRNDLNKYKQEFVQDEKVDTLEKALEGADVFIGVARQDLLSVEMLKSMAANPIVFALSNPDPEIRPELAHSVRSDLVIATGRSDYPNQINNVLCFPYIFRGALDVLATQINLKMQLAAVNALVELTHEQVVEEVYAAYPDATKLEFGPDYFIPKPLDPRLRTKVANAVAQAAIESGVSRKRPDKS